MNTLKDKAVLITGSSIGIGRETAFKFAEEGCKVVITYYKDKKEAENTSKKCIERGASYVIATQLNVMEDNSIKSCVKKVVDKFGKVRLIDFKSAARKQVNWENQNSILENFNKDYKTLKDSFRIILNIKGPMLENLFNTLVSKYPCSEQVKTAILDQILSL